MLRPNVRELLKTENVEKVIYKCECFIKSKQEKEKILAQIDLLRLYGKILDKNKFYSLALYLTSTINNSAVYRELARFVYFIEGDSDKAKLYANKAIKINEFEPLWVYYIARKNKTYFEKLHDNVYLTSIPKNASTSLKTMMIEKFHHNKNVNPHSVFGNPFFKTNSYDTTLNENDLKLISIREPISRFASYHNKNILEENSLKEELNYTEKNKEFGLDLRPTLDVFIENIALYCYSFNDVLHHILPQTAYFDDVNIYDVISDISEAHMLGEAVSNKLQLDNPIAPPKKMVSKRPVDSLKITEKNKSRISLLFKDDMSFYELRNKFKSKVYSFDFKGVNSGY